MLDLESEVMRGPGSIPTGGNILSLDFFHVVKPLMSILPLLSMLSIYGNCVFVKTWNVSVSTTFTVAAQ